MLKVGLTTSIPPPFLSVTLGDQVGKVQAIATCTACQHASI